MCADLLTPAEAAVIASVTVRDINRVIDEKILPERFYSSEDGRRIRLAACPLVGFYFHAAKALTAEERLRLIGRFSERITSDMAGCGPRFGANSKHRHCRHTLILPRELRPSLAPTRTIPNEG